MCETRAEKPQVPILQVLGSELKLFKQIGPFLASQLNQDECTVKTHNFLISQEHV